MDVSRPKRKSIRLKNYDYSQNGLYFVTICAQNRAHIFGEIVGATLCGRPESPCGRPESPRGRPESPDKMIEKWLFELENKFPGVIIGPYVIMPDHIHFVIEKSNPGERGMDTGMDAGDHAGNAGDHTGIPGDHAGSPLRDIIGWFKTMTTNEYIKNVKTGHYMPFEKRLWQRNYYEHIIRNEEDYINIENYIHNNPMRWEETHNA